MGLGPAILSKAVRELGNIFVFFEKFCYGQVSRRDARRLGGGDIFYEGIVMKDAIDALNSRTRDAGERRRDSGRRRFVYEVIENNSRCI